VLCFIIHCVYPGIGTITGEGNHLNSDRGPSQTEQRSYFVTLLASINPIKKVPSGNYGPAVGNALIATVVGLLILADIEPAEPPLI